MAVAKAPQRLRTLGHIRSAVLGLSGEPNANTTIKDRVELYINSRYDELLEQQNSFTIRESQIVLRPKETTGTVDVTQGSVTVSANATTAFSATDHVGQKFKVDSYREVYKVASVVSSSVLTLNVAYQGTAATNANYRIISYAYELPTDFDELISIWSDDRSREVRKVPISEFKELTNRGPTSEGRPRAITQDYEGNEGRPRMLIYPSANEAQSLHYDYQRKVRPMVKDETHLKDDQAINGGTITSFDNSASFDRLTHVSFVGSAASALGNITLTGTGWLGQTLTETVALNGTTEVISDKKYKTITSIALPATVAGVTLDIGIDDPPLLPEKSNRVLMYGALADVYEEQGDDSGKAWAEAKYREALLKIQANLEATRNPLRIQPKQGRKQRRPTPARFDLGTTFETSD